MRIARSIRSPLFAARIARIVSGSLRANQCFCLIRPAGIAGLRATSLSRRWLSSGHPGIGPMPATTTVITGCQARGSWHRNPVCSGLQRTGVGAATDLFSTTDIGASKSVSMAESVTAMDITVTAIEGGRWQNGQFYYNRSVNNVNVTNIHNVYNTTVINNTTINRVSYNGGNGGISARPTPQQESVAHERHIPPVAAQTQHEQAARTNPEQRAALNHGTPAVAATPKPGHSATTRLFTRNQRGRLITLQ